MAAYIFYNKNTGQVMSEHYGHPHDRDPLTESRQAEFLENQYGMTGQLSNHGILVSEGYNSKDLNSLISIDASGVKYVDLNGV